MIRSIQKRSLFNKLISLILIFTFASYNTGFAAVSKDAAKPKEEVLSAPLIPEDIGIAIDTGTVKSTYKGESGKMIVHIQDAHCNFEAQTNINKILEQLASECGIRMISVEGAEGLVDTAWFRAFPDAEIRKEVATYFMKKGEITGAEFFSINSDYEGTIFGAETREYYIKNLKAFTEVYPYKDLIEKYFNDAKTVTNRLKSIIYPPKLKDLDSKMSAFDTKELELSDYAAYLEKVCAKNSIDIETYPNFKKLTQTLEYEEKIDFDIVDSERSEYIDFLGKRLPKKDMAELVAESIRFKKGHIKAVDFYSYLRELAREKNIDMVQAYPNLFYYYIYTKLYEGIDNEKLFKEIDAIQRTLKERFFESETERTLDRYDEIIDMYVNLVNIELTNDDYDLFKEYSKEASIEDVFLFLDNLSLRYNLNYSIGTVPGEIVDNLPNMIAFYEIAMKRDKALIDNTLNEMQKSGKDRCVLIAGGFHTRGMKNLLEKEGVSYIVVTPKITKDVETPYIKVLTNQRTSLEDIITESTMSSASDSSSKEAVRQPVPDLMAPILITELMQLTLSEGGDEIIAEISAKGYGDSSVLRVRIEDISEEWVEKFVAGYIPKLKEVNAKRLEEDFAYTQSQIDKVWNSFIADGNGQWGIFTSNFLTKFIEILEKGKDVNETKIKETKEFFITAFEASRKDEKTGPGDSAAGDDISAGDHDLQGKVLELEQRKIYDKIIKNRHKNPEEIVQINEKSGNRLITFMGYKNLIEELIENDLPVNIHPGTGGRRLLKRRGLLQMHLDLRILEAFDAEENKIVANHELAHLDITNVERIYLKYKSRMKDEDVISLSEIEEKVNKELGENAEGALETWEKWVEAGRPTREEQEKFVNSLPGCRFTEEMSAKIDAVVDQVKKQIAEKEAEKRKTLEIKRENFRRLKDIVRENEGPDHIIAITNPGDGRIVKEDLEELKTDIARKDGKVKIIVHEEKTRRGQWLGLMDAIKAYGLNKFDKNNEVVLGIMMPGKGTRLSPITQSLHAIKPLIPMLIRSKMGKRWLSGATASLYSGNLIAAELKERGFRGILFRWGDEPQIFSTLLDKNTDFSNADIVRFGSTKLVTDYLAENKEWISADKDGNLVGWASRRKRKDLLKRLKVEDTPDAKALTHIGSFAASFDIMEEAIKVFIDLDKEAKEKFKTPVKQESWIDVDGYLIDALVMDYETWYKEMATQIAKENKRAEEAGEKPEETGILQVLRQCPDFYERAQEVKRRINIKKGKDPDAELDIKIVDAGEDLYWGDIGTLTAARETLHLINHDTLEGDFARDLADITSVKKDEYGNRIIGECVYPKDGSIKNSTLINSNITGVVDINNAVIIDSDLANVVIGENSVVHNSTVIGLIMGERSFSFKSIGENIAILSDYVHTSMPKNTDNIAEGLDDWYGDSRVNMGKGYYYDNPVFGNPDSLKNQREKMAQRNIPPTRIETLIKRNFRDGLTAKIESLGTIKVSEQKASGYRYHELKEKFPMPKFGTSGVRGKDKDLVDLVTYAIAKGATRYFMSLKDRNDLPKEIKEFIQHGFIAKGNKVTLAGDYRPSTPTILLMQALGILETGNIPEYIGRQPSPVTAYHGFINGQANIMVTGSHIPLGENGAKYNRKNAELWKEEEKAILGFVKAAMIEEYLKPENESLFNDEGWLKDGNELTPAQKEMVRKAREAIDDTTEENIQRKAETDKMYKDRSLNTFGKALKGVKFGYWAHTAVGSQLFMDISKEMGADVVEVNDKEWDLGNEFLPIDTENLTEEHLSIAKRLMEESNVNVLLTTDGDSDRPAMFIRDKKGEVEFIHGDKLGVLAALFLQPEFFALPVSANHVALDRLVDEGIKVQYTNVGSPYVALAMYLYGGTEKRTAGCEVNGGFFIGSEKFELPQNVKEWLEGMYSSSEEGPRPSGVIDYLPTRDALLPMLSALLLAKMQGQELPDLVKEVFSGKYEAYTKSGLVENTSERTTPGCEEYKPEVGKAVITDLSPSDSSIEEVYFSDRENVIEVKYRVKNLEYVYKERTDEDIKTAPPGLTLEMREIKKVLEGYLHTMKGLEDVSIEMINYQAGVQMYLSNNEVVHFRPSGNSAQFRIYARARTKERVAELVEEAERSAEGGREPGVLIKMLWDYINFAKETEERISSGTYAAMATPEVKSQLDAVVSPSPKPVVATQHFTFYDWAGKANNVLTELDELDGDIAEIWSNMTERSPRNPEAESVVVPAPDHTLRQLILKKPEVLSPGGEYTKKPFFTKTLATRFPDKIYLGFNEKINEVGRDTFTKWVKQEWDNVRRLNDALREDITEGEFNEYLKLYEEWAIIQGNNQWKLQGEDAKITSFIHEMGRYLKPGYNPYSVFGEISKTRRDIVSVLNEIELEDGMIIKSLAGYVHGIFGLSLQTHPMKIGMGISGRMEYPKNEAWIVKKIKDELGKEHTFLIEPQQTSDDTHSMADFYTPVVWDRENERPKLRKKVTGADIDHFMEHDLFWRSANPDDFMLQPKDITPEEAKNAGLELLIEASDVLSGTERISLSGTEGNKAEIVISNDMGFYNDLIITEGKAVVKIEGQEDTVLFNGGSVFIPGTIKRYTIESETKAEIIRTYPREDAFTVEPIPELTLIKERDIREKGKVTQIAPAVEKLYLKTVPGALSTISPEIEINTEKINASEVGAMRLAASYDEQAQGEYEVYVKSGSIQIGGKELTQRDSIKVKGADFDIMKTSSESAVLEIVMLDEADIVKDLNALFGFVETHSDVRQEKPIDIFVKKGKYKTGSKEDQLSLEWIEDILNKLRGSDELVRQGAIEDKLIKINLYDFIEECSIRDEAVGILVATDKELGEASEVENADVQKFLGDVRVLSMESDKETEDMVFNLLGLKVCGTALMQAIIDKGDIQSGTSIAQDALLVMSQLTGRFVKRDSLYAMLSFNEGKSLLADVMGMDINDMNIKTFMGYIITNLSLKPMKALTQNLQQEVENLMKTLWAA